MARADVAVLINYDTNRSLIVFADEIFRFSSLSFVLGDGRVTELNLASILKHRSERANSTPMWGRQISAVAGLQNCNRVVCSRTKMIHYIWSSKQLCRQFVNEFIWIFRFSLAPVYVIWFAHEALLAYFPSSCYVYLFHTVLTVVLF